MEQRGRVMIVDDNAMNIDVLRRILRKEYDLETALSGEEALTKLEAFQPQLMLLDIMMPGIDGYTTCRQIKTGPFGEGIQVILVSGKGSTADKVQGYEALADDYIVKPFNHEELLAKVRARFRLLGARPNVQQRRADEVSARLYGLINQMSEDIAEHNGLIAEIQRELSASEVPSPDSLIQAMVRLADTNKATQGRLASAEHKLRDRAHEIESHASEARTDALTLLPNRRAFDEDLEHRLKETDQTDQSLVAAMIDVDHFKCLNDQYGHPAGDEVLQAIGRVLRNSVRPADLAARCGGDEFAVIMSPISLADARCIAARIREVVCKSIVCFEDQTLRVTISIGLALRLPEEDGPSLIKRADKALYAAKKAGRDCVCLHDGEQSYSITEEAPPQAATSSGRSMSNMEIASLPLLS